MHLASGGKIEAATCSFVFCVTLIGQWPRGGAQTNTSRDKSRRGTKYGVLDADQIRKRSVENTQTSRMMFMMHGDASLILKLSRYLLVHNGSCRTWF